VTHSLTPYNRVNSLVEITLSLTPFWKTVPSQLRNANLNPVTWFRKDNDAPLTTGVDPENEDPSPPEDQVPTLWWTIGLAVTTVGSCAIFATMFHMNVGEAILALLLGFMFSFIGVQSSGQTDVNPVGTVAKASQLIFGGVTKGMSMIPAQTINLTAGVVAAGAAAQATDMTGDLKTGFLLRAKPRNQFLAQCIGSFISVFLNVGLFVLFTKASPCIITGEDPCAYGAPSISAWAAVAVAVTSPKLPIPPSSGYTAIGLSIAAGLTVTAKVCGSRLLLSSSYCHTYVPFLSTVLPHPEEVLGLHPELERHRPRLRRPPGVLLYRHGRRLRRQLLLAEAQPVRTRHVHVRPRRRSPRR
jgi:hypothetical protein